MARGYWQRPAAERERFRPDPRGTGATVVYSGDLVRRDEAGRHYFVARRDRTGLTVLTPEGRAEAEQLSAEVATALSERLGPLA